MPSSKGAGKGLVSEAYKVRVKVGRHGEMGIPGKVEKFENDTPYVRVGAKLFKVPLSQMSKGSPRPSCRSCELRRSQAASGRGWKPS